MRRMMYNCDGCQGEIAGDHHEHALKCPNGVILRITVMKLGIKAETADREEAGDLCESCLKAFIAKAESVP